MPTFGQINVNSFNTTLYHGPKQTIRSPSFPIFHEKNNCSHAQILSKKPSFSKKHNALIPIFYPKIVHSLKNTVLSCHFFNFFMKNHLLSCPYLVKNVNSVRTTLQDGPKKSIGCPFFPIFHEKITTLMPTFCQKTSIL